jgi:hypothetical protein
MKYFSRSFNRLIANILLISLTAGAAFGQYPATGNKQRLGFQTTGDGLVYRGRLSDTTAIKPANINNAFYLQDTINDKLYRYIKTNGGWQPVQGRVQKLGVGADGANGATLYLSGTDTDGSSAEVVVDNVTDVRLPWDGSAVIGIITTVTTSHAVTITGTGLISITETVAVEDGEITIDATIPTGHIDYTMLSQAVKDSIAQGGTGETDLSFSGATSPVNLLSSTGDSVTFLAGDYITLGATDSTMTINSVTNLSVTQGASGETFVVVDNVTDVQLPWDGNAVVGYVETGSQTTIFLTVNGQQVQFDPIPNGDKGDIIVSDAGAVMMIDTGVVDWDNLTQAVRDSILLGFSLPTDSITFNNNESDPDSLELQYNYDKGSLVYGANGGVEIPILPGHWFVRNDTTVTLTKGTVVRATGTLGASGRIKVKHMIADGSIDAMYLLGIAAHDIAPGADGYVMSQGKIRKINTNAYTQGAVLYADDFIPGALMETLPSSSKLKLPIAFVVHKATNGTLAVRIDPGSYLRDLHDVGLQGAVAGDVLKLANNGTWQPGKDSTIYKFDGTLTGNRTMFMNGFQLLFKDTSDIYDYVDIRENYVSVTNTFYDNRQTMTQYGFQNGGIVDSNETEIRMEGGIIAMYANNAATTSPTPGADLRIDGDGVVKFRVSAPGALDSIYGKNSSGELTAADIGTGLEISSGVLKQKILVASDSIDFASITGIGSLEQTITVTGAALSDPVTLGIPNAVMTMTNGEFAIYTAYVSATDTVKVRFSNTIAGNTLNPPKALFKIIVHKY